MKRTLLLIALATLALASWGEAPHDYGWQLHDRDWDNIRATIERAPEFGVTEIRLSHGIITCIDDIVENPETERIVKDACELAGRRGLKVYVWAKELNIGKRKHDQDLDPEGGGKAMWDARRAAYREAFTRCPGLHGIVLQFGSCPTEVWHIPGRVSEFNARTPNDERVALTIRIVKEVCGEFGKRMDVRTFCHSANELEWARAGIAKVPGVRAMIKEVPQDWQPYYPLNPIIGDVGPNESLIEFDLGAEYWGIGATPFCMVDYLAWRMRAMAPKGIAGAVARVECGSRHALGTPNEANLYALSCLLDNPGQPPAAIWHDWVAKRYGADTETEEGARLVACLRRSFDVGRKMYYVLTAWALEKSSDIPEQVRAACLVSKNSAQWDADFRDGYRELCNPSADTLVRIWQEKEEAIELAARSLADLEAARAALKPGDHEDLRRRMAFQHQCTQVWKYVADAVFRSMLYAKTGKKLDRQILEGDIQALEGLAREMPKDAPIANPARIALFVEDLRARLPECKKAGTPDINVLSNIRAEDVNATEATICWTCAKPAAGRVEWGSKLPNFDRHAETGAAASEHRVRILALEPGKRYVFRVRIDGNTSGDYVINTPPS